MKTIIWLLYITVVIYVMLDGVHTKMLLDLGAKEVNPILNWLIAYTGTVYVIFYVKAATLLFLLILLTKYLDDSQKELEHVK